MGLDEKGVLTNIVHDQAFARPHETGQVGQL